MSLFFLFDLPRPAWESGVTALILDSLSPARRFVSPALVMLWGKHLYLMVGKLVSALIQYPFSQSHKASMSLLLLQHELSAQYTLNLLSHGHVVILELTGYCLFCQQRGALNSHYLIVQSTAGCCNRVYCYCDPHIGHQILFVTVYCSSTRPMEFIR